MKPSPKERLLRDAAHTVSQILGHSKASITPDVYAHAVDRGGEVAGEQLTRLLSAQTGAEGGRAKDTRT